MVKDTCNQVGVSIEADKKEGPSICITFLGMESDSINLIIKLPGSKLMRQILLLLLKFDTNKLVRISITTSPINTQLVPSEMA